MKIVFMGTPDFALEPLRALIASGHDIAAVITKEDKPKNRGHKLSFTPVKEEALKHGIRIMQPRNMRDEGLYEELKHIGADLFVVVAYGKLLPKEILDIPPLGCINIHASLLPAYRGAAPIQWAIIKGEKKTGITTMLMDEGLDTGDILKRYEIDIAEDETGGSLFEKLSVLGGKAITDTISELESGTLRPRKQGEASTDYASALHKEMGDIDFSKPADYIERLIRGLNPWPGAYSDKEGKLLKIWGAKLLDIEESGAVKYQEGDYGRMIRDKWRLFVVCGGGLLEITQLQPEGKKRMDASVFLRGYDVEGCRLQRRG